MTIDTLDHLRNIHERRVAFTPGMLSESIKASLPEHFPYELWADQSRRYLEYWQWFTGEALLEIEGRTAKNRPVYRFPLAINPVRNFARKHAALLWGEAPDTPDAFVRSVVSPKTPFMADQPTDAERKEAESYARIVNEVWSASNGRSIQQEGGILSQFLGGYVLQLCYEPEAEDLLIPLRIKGILPDFFMPIWEADNYWNLLEAFVIYRIPAASARLEYGEDFPDLGAYAIYCEHWTRDSYSITINGEPISKTFATPDGQIQIKKVYLNASNPFGFVPFVYVPHVREGGFFGSSIVPDIQGLVKELNTALANEGTLIRNAAHRKRYVKNVIGQVKPLSLAPGVDAMNLGVTPPTAKHEPKVETEDIPTLPQGLVDYPERIQELLVREAQSSDVFFGKDEGSQRSALTLAFRMLPATSHARAERTCWTDGLNTMAKMILRMCATHPTLRAVLARHGVSVKPDFLKRMNFSQDWPPMIPRDREALVDEIILRKQTDLISPQHAMEKFGDVKSIPQELEQIKDWLDSVASREAKFAVRTKPGGNGSGAKIDISEPVASTGLKE